MDHLIWPKSRKWPIPKIPYETLSYNFDGGEWETFPERMGWHPRSADHWDLLFRQPTRELIAFLKCWRYIAYLRSIFSQDIIDQHLLHRIGGTSYLNSSRLPSIINKAVTRSDILKEYPTPEKDNIAFLKQSYLSGSSLYEIHVIAGKARTVEQRFAIDRNQQITLPGGHLRTELRTMYNFILIFKPPQDPLCPLFVDAIWLAHELVENILTRVSTPLDPGRWAHLELEEILRDPKPVPLRLNSFATKKLLEAGWCLSRIQYLNSTLSPSALLFCAHFSSPDLLDHGRCTLGFCQFERVDMETYETKHTHDYCSCEVVKVDNDELHNILSSGTYPLISVSASDTTGAIPLHANNRDGKEPYVAISHVWSDGLGNPQENGVPRCQLKRLCALTSNISSNFGGGNDGSFWLDTICCPVEDGSEDQKMALSLMEKTYRRARSVVVLDSFLLQDATTDMTDAEIFLRIACSKWTSRLWTFQEGAVASRLIFQLSDGIFDLTSRWDTFRKQVYPQSSLTIFIPIYRRISDACMLNQKPGSEEMDFQAVSRALEFRSTSVSTDEPICLTNIMGHDSKDIVGLSSEPRHLEQRMCAFWAKCRKIPSSIIFRHYESLPTPGYRWAPRSFIFGTSGKPLEHKREDNWRRQSPPTVQYFGQPTAQGLHLTMPGWDLNHYWQSGLGSRFYFRDRENSRWYLVSVVQDLISQRDRTVEPFVIWEKPPPGASWRLMILGDGMDGGFQCWLVNRVRFHNNIHYVRKIALVVVTIVKEEPDWNPVQDLALDDAPYPKWTESMWEKVSFVSFLNGETEWCLD